ncbi:hypothetical protein CGL51_14380, partial [Pyrobaculum aerophilum]
MLEPLVLVPFIGLAMAGLIREYGFWRKEDRDFAQACKKISVIIPMRGVHPSTESNLVAITSQKVNTDVEYIFVVDSDVRSDWRRHNRRCDPGG